MAQSLKLIKSGRVTQFESLSLEFELLSNMLHLEDCRLVRRNPSVYQEAGCCSMNSGSQPPRSMGRKKSLDAKSPKKKKDASQGVRHTLCDATLCRIRRHTP